MAKINDNDVLDMTGTWKATFAFGIGYPLVIAPKTFFYNFNVTGPGEYGGMKFKGIYSDPAGQPDPTYKDTTLLGETYYDKRGVHIVQFLQVSPGNQYLAIMSGAHKQDSAHPGPARILGGWVDIGGYVANFEMVKVK